MASRSSVAPEVAAALEERARPETRDWWERYLKGAIAFRGVKMADVRVAQDPAAAEPIAAWRHADGLCQRRAAAVAFVNLVPRADEAMTRLVLTVLDANVRDPARFSQTSVGWVLRELVKAQPEAVDDFVARNGHRMSREALRQSRRGH